MGRDLGFKVHVMEPIRIDHTLVSSTSIRELIQEGNLPEAHKLLGRHYQIWGTVVRGKNRGGRLLGCPTANLEFTDELIPKEGVYAVEVFLEDERYYGVTNIGHNPTFGANPLSVETHLLDFSIYILGKMLRMAFLKRLRDEKTYESIQELSDRISKDIAQARQIFGLQTG
jgi:riboflavin kinase/FMN adenylyltransferase